MKVIGKSKMGITLCLVSIVGLFGYFSIIVPQTQPDHPNQPPIEETSWTTNNYQYEKAFTKQEFEQFIQGENPTLIEGVPELPYDEKIVHSTCETLMFYRTENAYYLYTKQGLSKSVMYRFQQVGDNITGYIRYDLLRS